jgi:hypothetical protein
MRDHVDAGEAAGLAHVVDSSSDLRGCLGCAQRRRCMIRGLEHCLRSTGCAIAGEVESARDIAARCNEAQPGIAGTELVSRREQGREGGAVDEQHAGLPSVLRFQAVNRYSFVRVRDSDESRFDSSGAEHRRQAEHCQHGNSS